MDNTNPNATPVPSLIPDLDRLRIQGVDKLLLTGVLFWMIYMVSSFRLPTTPITISDENAFGAIRQLVFAGTGLLAIARLMITRTLMSILVLRWPLTALTMLIVLSVLWSDQSTLTIKRSIIFVCGFLALITVVHSSKQPVSLMLETVVIFCALVSFLSLLFNVVLPEACTVNPERPGLSGISNHPNTIAPFLSAGLILSLGFSAKTASHPILLRLARLILLAGLFLSFSVTSWITTLAAFGIYTFLNANNYRRGAIQILTVITIALVAAIGLQTLKSGFFDATGRDESLSGRDELWKVTWTEVKKKPLIGHGFGAFWTESKGRDLVQTWNPRQTHHAYLDLLLDLGLVGLIAVMVLFPLRLFLSWFKISGSAKSDRRRAAAAMLAIAIGNLTFYAFSQSYFLRFDSFPFFLLVWITLLFTNKDRHNMTTEFKDESSIDHPQTQRPLICA